LKYNTMRHKETHWTLLSNIVGGKDKEE
jgi:hypothetical protein